MPTQENSNSTERQRNLVTGEYQDKVDERDRKFLGRLARHNLHIGAAQEPGTTVRTLNGNLRRKF